MRQSLAGEAAGGTYEADDHTVHGVGATAKRQRPTNALLPARGDPVRSPRKSWHAFIYCAFRALPFVLRTRVVLMVGLCASRVPAMTRSWSRANVAALKWAHPSVPYVQVWCVRRAVIGTPSRVQCFVPSKQVDFCGTVYCLSTCGEQCSERAAAFGGGSASTHQSERFARKLVGSDG